MLLTKCRVREGGLSAQANSVSSRRTRVVSETLSSSKKPTSLKPVAVGEELGRAHRHLVAHVVGDHLQPLDEAIGVEQVGLAIEELRDLAVERVPGAQDGTRSSRARARCGRVIMPLSHS